MKAVSTWEETPLLQLKIPGLGPKSKQKLHQAGITRVGDLLSFLPREYLDYSKISPIDEAPLEMPVHIRGVVLSKKKSTTLHKRLDVIEVLVDDGHGSLRLVWYNQPYLGDKIPQGATLSFFGKIRFEKFGRTMTNPRFEGNENIENAGIHAVYKQVGGLRSDQIGRWVAALVERMPQEETLAGELVKKHAWPTRKASLAQLHQPAGGEEMESVKQRTSPALRRLIFEEFYYFQQRLQELVSRSQNRDHPCFAVDGSWLEAFYKHLPFQPTQDQERVIGALFQGLEEKRRLHGLIQGDVGCGKTLIGLALAYIFFRAGYQSALLCPTTVLAHQHMITAQQLLGPLGLKSVLLTAQSSGAEIDERLASVASGEAHLVIGTHKLFQRDVIFADLGLAMIDEQHRFGVDQRRALLKKGSASHYLAFSATPIPRSLAMTLYGDYQVLSIHEKPHDRPPIRTILKRAENRGEIVAFAKRRMDRGESVFWVFPLIEGNEAQQERSAENMFATFQSGYFRGRPLRMVHGRMKKERIRQEMGRFKEGEPSVLVATTVIEVGVDVPIASIMVVEGAEQFGLSQLHQLRGRVGRNDREAFCFFVLPENITGPVLERMKLLAMEDDGFKIAAYDLDQRGSGDLLGKRQSGFTNFRFGDPWIDRQLMDLARQEAISALSIKKVTASSSGEGAESGIKTT